MLPNDCLLAVLMCAHASGPHHVTLLPETSVEFDLGYFEMCIFF